MQKIIIYSAISMASATVVYFLIRRTKKSRKVSNDLNPDQMKQWRKERRKNREEVILDVKAMGDNVEKSHDLWKELSKVVHESKWLSASDAKKKLAEELNMLVNKHKNNYKELKKLEDIINRELLV